MFVIAAAAAVVIVVAMAEVPLGRRFRRWRRKRMTRRVPGTPARFD